MLLLLIRIHTLPAQSLSNQSTGSLVEHSMKAFDVPVLQ